jgi:exosortase family protein XrtM
MVRSASMLPAASAAFIARFAAGYVVLYLLYGLVPDDVLRDHVFHWGLALPGAAIIDMVVPAHAAVAQANVIASERAVLEIVRGCEGAGVFFLLGAAMVALPGGLRTRLAGAAVGLALVYALNLARIVALYFVLAQRGAWFELAHLYVAPLAVLGLVAVFFWWWSDDSARPAATADAAA